MADSPSLAAATFVDELGRNTVLVLENTASSSPTRDIKLREVLGGAFNFEIMTQRVLVDSWHGATVLERKHLNDLFRNYFLDYCVRLLDRYEPNAFDLVSAQHLGRESALITTSASCLGVQIAAVGWMVEFEKDKYRVVDVIIDKVSTVRTYRSEFGSVVDRAGLNGLITALRDRAPK